MTVESATLFSQLNAAWPQGTDGRLEGDDHIRLVKTVLQGTFSDTSSTFVITKGAATYSFNNSGALTINGAAVGTVTSVTGTAPVVSSGGSTPAISMAVATASANGYLASTDWTTFNNKEPPISVGTTSQYRRGDKTWQTLDKIAVGLTNVDNTSDVNKPVSTAQQTALNLKADLASPPLTGIPTAPTATAGTNTTQLATTAFVTTALAGVGGGATISDTAPGSPSQGSLWWDSSTGGLFIYYNDGTSSQWVQLN